MEFVNLGNEENAFASGGNRLCFVDPRNPHQCIKVIRKDRSPAYRRNRQNVFKRLRRLESYDENLNEFKIIKNIFANAVEDPTALVTQVIEFVETNLGRGLVTSLIRDANGEISVSLKQYLWINGLNQTLKKALSEFEAGWTRIAIPSRKLLLHNILVRKNEDGTVRLIVIDGLGDPTFISLSKLSYRFAARRASRKFRELTATIQELLEKKQAGAEFGVHGWLKKSDESNISS